MKKTVLTAALGTVAAAGLWIGALSPRRNQPGWEKLAGHRYAHRGLHNMEKGLPENSLGAFRAALEAGFGAELDVHLMRDGNLAVVHDSSLLRVCGADVKVEELTAAELGNYRLMGTDETIPLLEDVLALFCGRAPLIVELKTVDGNAGPLTDAVMERLSAFQGDYCIESFDPAVLLHLRARYPDVIRGQLSCDFLRHEKDVELSLPARAVMTYLLTTFAAKPDFIAYGVRDRHNTSLRLMKELYGVHEVGWTVRSPEVMEALEQEDVTVIFEGFVPD